MVEGGLLRRDVAPGMSLKLARWCDHADSRRRIDEEGSGMVTATEQLRVTAMAVGRSSLGAAEWLLWSEAPSRR